MRRDLYVTWAIEIGREERLRNDLFLCRVEHKTLTQSIRMIQRIFLVCEQ